MKILRVFTRLGLVATMVAVLGVACAGEAVVSYEGTVVAGEAGSFSFDEARNPSGGDAIADARVAISIGVEGATGNMRITTTDAAGRWGPVHRTFGSIGGSIVIRIEASAEGFEPIAYSAIYETTDDPLDGELFLNFVLTPSEG